MKKIFAILLVTVTVLAVFFFLRFRPESRTNFDQPKPAPTEASGVGLEGSGSVYTEISPSDCSNECTSYKEDAERHTYCRTVCGFTSEEGVVTPPASADPSLSNDYTLKEEAIRERNIKKCGLITDANLRKSCQVRVTEDLLE